MASDGDIQANIMGLKPLQERLARMNLRGQNLRVPFKVAGKLMVSSVQRNFQVGGRPRKWKPSIRALLEGNRTLVKSGALEKSTNFEAEHDRLRLRSNLKYAKVHQFGSAKRNIPKRPFIVFQREDRQDILKILDSYIMRGRTR